MNFIDNALFHFLKMFCCLIPNKKLRQKIRFNIAKKLFQPKYLKKLRRLYPEHYFFAAPKAGIGEITQVLVLLCELQKHIDRKILLITYRKQENAIAAMFSDYILIYYNPSYKFLRADPFTNLEFHSGLYLHEAYDFGLLQKSSDHFSVLDKIAEIYGIQVPKTFQTPKFFPNSLAPSIKNILKEKKVLFIFPHSNTIKIQFGESQWIGIADELTALGFECIFNSEQKFGRYTNVLLPFPETLVLCKEAAAIIAVRSGITELITVATKTPIFALYPCSINNDTFSQSSLKNNFKRDHLSDYKYQNNIPKLIEDIKQFLSNTVLHPEQK